MSEIKLDDPYYDRLRSFLDWTRSETERGRALIAASLIEEMLEEIIRSFLLKNKATNKLFDAPNAPLSTLSAKCSFGRALGLISDPEYRDIDLVRKIRNEFAHSVMCSFDDKKIQGWATELKVGMSALDALEKGHKSRVDDPKQRFSMVTTSIISALYNRAHYAKEARLKERAWPA